MNPATGAHGTPPPIAMANVLDLPWQRDELSHPRVGPSPTAPARRRSAPVRPRFSQLCWPNRSIGTGTVRPERVALETEQIISSALTLAGDETRVIDGPLKAALKDRRGCS